MEALKSFGRALLEVVGFTLEVLFMWWVYTVVLDISATAAGIVAAVFLVYGAIRAIVTLIQTVTHLAMSAVFAFGP